MNDLLDAIHEYNKRGWDVAFLPSGDDHVKWKIRVAMMDEKAPLGDAIIYKDRHIAQSIADEARLPEEDFLVNELRLLAREFENMLHEKKKERAEEGRSVSGE